MSWCQLIVGYGYDCFEFGFLSGMIFMLLIVFLYVVIGKIHLKLGELVR